MSSGPKATAVTDCRTIAVLLDDYIIFGGFRCCRHYACQASVLAANCASAKVTSGKNFHAII